MMTGRQKVEAALSGEGAPEIPAMICYEDIFIRDHWSQLTSCPWWYRDSPDVEHHFSWRRAAISRTGQELFRLPFFHAREEREQLSIEVRPDGVFRLDGRSGTAQRLAEPAIGGWSSMGQSQSVHPASLAETTAEIDALLPSPPDPSLERIKVDGRKDLASRLLGEFGESHYPIIHVHSPLWLCYSLWGFEGMMTMVATRPDLVGYACERILEIEVHALREGALIGAAGAWIEECLTDMISPRAFESLNLPWVARLVGEIRAAGLKSIYYYCGSPEGKWELLLAAGADALALEESKKGFAIEIDDIVRRVNGRCAVLGNLDAIGVLQDGTDARLREEIARQIAAGRRNGSRFIMSLGSPVTPGTPVERVRLYTDLARELGSR